jgi:DNA ligase (NAD+)
MNVSSDDKKRIKKLRELVAYHQKRYHTDDSPEISDETYDSLLSELEKLELKTEGKTSDVTEALGAQRSNAFAKVKHISKQWSFDKAFSFAELADWEVRIGKLIQEADIKDLSLSYVAEHKIDGLKLVLVYRSGFLVQAVTRGDGNIGEDVTHTALTIKDVPTELKYPVDLVCVGEVWLSGDEFARINSERLVAGEALFANPRNAAAGSLRQLDPEVARGRNLSMFCYDIDVLDLFTANLVVPTTQIEELLLLKQLGLPTNLHAKRCNNLEEVKSFYTNWKTDRSKLSYGIDGVVVKVNDIKIQELLGYTSRAPRFGTALKFPAEQVTTIVESIELQVGRTGVVTPVAWLRPVLIDGSTVARATLHNEDQIKRLDVRAGDTVVLQKAGDIIPEVVEVLLALRPSKTKPFLFPKTIPECGGDGSIERIDGEVAYRCVVLDSDWLFRQRLYYFVSKSGLNIDGVGPKIIDQLLDTNLIKEYADLFTLTVEDLKVLPGFKIKSAENVVSAIASARVQPISKFLTALGIDQVGEETSRIITRNYSSLEELMSISIEELSGIHGVGPIVASSLWHWLHNAKNADAVIKLLQYIELATTISVQRETPLTGKTVVLTGTLPTLTRDQAKDIIRLAGGSVTSSVSKKTDYVLLGENAGSKATEAVTLEVKTLTEKEFLLLVA